MCVRVAKRKDTPGFFNAGRTNFVRFAGGEKLIKTNYKCPLVWTKKG
jgi:hypothetical protein